MVATVLFIIMTKDNELKIMRGNLSYYFNQHRKPTQEFIRLAADVRCT
ncbi:MAG: hypothetical protein RI909_1247 [Bacteroidota bacterium]|jgi:hypothetical protein